MPLQQHTIQITLTPDLERQLTELVRSGRYETKSEAVQEALWALSEREALTQQVRKKIERRLLSIVESGETPQPLTEERWEQICANARARAA